MDGNLWHSDLPRKGWTETDVVDTEDYGFVHCSFCGTALRYVHLVRHPDVLEEKEVGCDCSGHLTENYVGAQNSESRLKKWVSKRKRWIQSPKWKVYSGSNWLKTLRYDDKVEVFRSAGFNNYRVKIGDTLGNKYYPDISTAKKKAFEYLYPKPKLGS